MKTTKKRLLEITDKFKNKKIIVIGDVMLDEYIYGCIKGKSPEAPVPLIKVKNRQYIPGGAGNAAVNLASLGTKVYLAGIRGLDVDGDILSYHLKKYKINVDCLLNTKTPTTVKTRIVCEGQQIVRYDTEKINLILTDTAVKIRNFIKKRIRHIDGVLISDYNKGMNKEELMHDIIKLCKKYKKPVVVDSKSKDFLMFRWATLFTPNLHDATMMFGFTNRKNVLPEDIASFLSGKLGSNLLMTMGPKGIILCEKDKPPVLIPTTLIEKCDPTGAGDTVSATALLAITSGATYIEATNLAQVAAKKVIQKVGTANITLEELKDEINKF